MTTPRRGASGAVRSPYSYIDGTPRVSKSDRALAEFCGVTVPELLTLSEAKRAEFANLKRICELINSGTIPKGVLVDGPRPRRKQL